MAVTTAIPPARLDAATPVHRDVVLILGYTSWTGAAGRSRVHREDRLTLKLIDSERVERLLVCNPFRSLPIKLLRRVIGSPEEPFPASKSRQLHEPLRARRSDPTGLPAIERSCAAYERSVRRAAAAMDLRRPAVITTHPLIAGFGRFDWAGPVTYHATDDLTAYPPFKRWVPAFEASFSRMRENSRRTVAVTQGALRTVRPGGPAAVIPNGVEPSEWIEPGSPPAWFLDLPRPRMLYVGSLDERIDSLAVRAVADAWPEGSVALVGRITGADGIAALKGVPNVTVRPRVHRREFSGLLAAADLGLIPHVRSAQTETMSPLKLYEYLAAGVPVAATDLPGIAGVCPARTRLAKTGADLVAAAREALELGDWPEPARQQFIIDNAWSRRFEQLLDIALATEPPSDPPQPEQRDRRNGEP